MLPYGKVKTQFRPPTSQPVPGAPAQGEWVSTEGVRVLEHWGHLRPLPAELVDSPFGQTGRQYLRWRGQLPDEVEPECGWEIRIAEYRFRVIVVQLVKRGLWRLDLERI